MLQADEIGRDHVMIDQVTTRARIMLCVGTRAWEERVDFIQPLVTLNRPGQCARLATSFHFSSLGLGIDVQRFQRSTARSYFEGSSVRQASKDIVAAPFFSRTGVTGKRQSPGISS